jgi:hypothetical protein
MCCEELHEEPTRTHAAAPTCRRARRRRRDLRPTCGRQNGEVASESATRLRYQDLVLGVEREAPQRTRRVLLLASRAALHQRHERRDGASLRDQDLVLGVGREVRQRTRRVLLLRFGQPCRSCTFPATRRGTTNNGSNGCERVVGHDSEDSFEGRLHLLL